MDKKKTALIAFAGLILALLIFHAGVVFGSRHRIREERPFDGRWFSHSFMEGGHGAVGTVGEIATSSLTLMTRAGAHETVVLSASTTLRTPTGATTSVALAAGARIIVLGTRDASGRLVADVIRILNR